MTAPALSLPETLLLLCIDAGERGVRGGLSLGHVLGGAQLRELQLAGRVALVAGRVTPVDAAPTGDRQLDELLAKIAGAREQPRSASHWVMLRKTNVVELYAGRLGAAGLVRRRRTRVLGIVPRTIYPIVDEPARERALAQLAAGAGEPDAARDERAAALVALVAATRSFDALVADPTLRAAAERICAGDEVACAVRRAIDALRASAAAPASAGA